jgi:hypothetical protein
MANINHILEKCNKSLSNFRLQIVEIYFDNKPKMVLHYIKMTIK